MDSQSRLSEFSQPIKLRKDFEAKLVVEQCEIEIVTKFRYYTFKIEILCFLLILLNYFLLDDFELLLEFYDFWHKFKLLVELKESDFFIIEIFRFHTN